MFTTIGFARLPARFNTGLDETREFSHTAYNFPRLLDVCEKLARQFLVRYGGRIEKHGAGEELLRKAVSPATCTQGHWLVQDVDLSRFAGQKVEIELINQPSGWAYEAAYWAEIAVKDL